jgi:tetrahydromethanopterin S-methyltransferase subunit C
MPTVAFFTCVLIGFVLKPQTIVDEVKETDGTFKSSRLFVTMIKWVAPIFILAILAFSVAIAGSYDMTAIYENVVATGFIAVLFILCTMAIQHPFNACLGPNEDQVRTLKCAASTAFLSMTLVGLMSVTSGGLGWFIVFIVGLIGWIISFRAFVLASMNDAASTKWAGLWPKVEN